MNASSEGRVTPYFYSPAASGVKIVICAPPPPGEEEFGRNAPKRLIVSQSCAEDIFGPKAKDAGSLQQLVGSAGLEPATSCL